MAEMVSDYGLCAMFAVMLVTYHLAQHYAKRDTVWAALSLAFGGSNNLKQETSSAVAQEKQVANASTATQSIALQRSKQLFHKLHNEESFPLVKEEARAVLKSLMTETAELARSNDTEPDILKIKQFDASSLHKFIQHWDDVIQSQWESYIKGRRSGLPRDLFQTTDDARKWLQSIAPSKLVDGAWLGHIRVMDVPFLYQDVARNAWQVLSEELGDGDLPKNHVYVFRELLNSVVPRYPEADSVEFLNADGGLADMGTWNSAIAQLSISHFPEEFLPEILGFNLHFELLTLDTIRASQELREIKLDPSYFMLHISIDNSDSGHTAMALQTVCQYMDIITQTESESVVHKIWQRIQQGFCLSQFVASTKGNKAHTLPRLLSSNTADPDYWTRLVKTMFQKKASVSSKIHAGCRSRIQGKSIQQWLSPEEIGTEAGALTFVNALSNAKPWVYKGDSARSRFVHEISWGGRMFGSFTDRECDTVKGWIDSLSTKSGHIQPTVQGADSKEPAIEQDSTSSLSGTEPPAVLDNAVWVPQANLVVRPSTFFPLWFAAASLLEGFVAVPLRVSNPFACELILALRAQLGLHEVEGVAGTDEALRTDTMSITGFGRLLLAKAGYTNLSSQSQSVKEILAAFPAQSTFPVTMTDLSAKPWTNSGLVIGMAQAFAEVHGAMAQSSCLEYSDRTQLADISMREVTHLNAAVALLTDHSETKLSDVAQGYRIAREHLSVAFVEGGMT